MTIRTVGKLSPARVRTAKPSGNRTSLVIGDGGGLWLQCTSGEGGHVRRSWTFRYELNGRRREMGLGPTHTLGLADAREKARALRLQLLDGTDPLEHREATRRANAVAAAKAMPFRECARLYLALHESGWGAKHAEQWNSSLRDYVFPVLGDLPVADIDQAVILKIIEPLWQAKTVTATRIRGRIESVLDYASASGFRTGDNPARALLAALPKAAKTHKVEHHSAVPWKEMPSFMAALRGVDSVAARALEFTALTATRTSEAGEATWAEVDTKARVWVIPGSRMKAGKEHRIPLSDRALEILSALPRDRARVFGSLHNKALSRVVGRLHRGATVHGMRSSFRDWARESTNFADSIVEAALAHAVGSKTVAAYARGDLFDRRRELMNAWSAYCEQPSATPDDAKVVAIGQRK
jgi:integrase